MKKKNHRENKRPSIQRQTGKALGGHIRARNRPAVRKIMATY